MVLGGGTLLDGTHVVNPSWNNDCTHTNPADSTAAAPQPVTTFATHAVATAITAATATATLSRLTTIITAPSLPVGLPLPPPPPPLRPPATASAAAGHAASNTTVTPHCATLDASTPAAPSHAGLHFHVVHYRSALREVRPAFTSMLSLPCWPSARPSLVAAPSSSCQRVPASSWKARHSICPALTSPWQVLAQARPLMRTASHERWQSRVTHRAVRMWRCAVCSQAINDDATSDGDGRGGGVQLSGSR
eukprot:6309148-Prymnesium_polylepis.1